MLRLLISLKVTTESDSKSFLLLRNIEGNIYKPAKQMKRACRENDGDREKTVNGTQPQNCFSPSYLSASKIGQAFACCLFLVVSLVGNTVIARTTTKNFILKMAMSDLLLPILVFSVESH